MHMNEVGERDAVEKSALGKKARMQQIMELRVKETYQPDNDIRVTTLNGLTGLTYNLPTKTWSDGK